MKRAVVFLSALGLIMGAFAGNLASDQLADVSVKISPNTIALNSKVPSVTVHVGIPFSSVERGSVTLEDIPALFIFADDRGNLVAKFSMSAVKGIVAPPQATLFLSGETTDGDFFGGSDTVRVKK